MTRSLLRIGALLLLVAATAVPASAQRTHGTVVGTRGNEVRVRMSPSLDVRPGVRGTIYGNVRGRQGIIARITSARKVGDTWTCTINRSALRVQPGHTVAFNATVPIRPAEPPRPPEPGTIVIDTQNTDRALITSGGVRMGRTEYSQRFSPRNATFYVQKDGFQTERVVVDIREGQTTRRDVTLRAIPPPAPRPDPEPEPPAPVDPVPVDPAPVEPEPTPTDPEPTDPTPVDPAPVDPAPTDPEPDPPPVPLPQPVAPPTTEPERDPGFPPSPETDGTITIYTSEPGVDVVINGLPILRTRDETEVEVQVIPGTYDVAVYKGGFFALPHRIRVGPNEEAPIRFDLLEANAQIVVNSDPVGARVKLAGVEVGATPLIIPYAPGRYEITVEADGYRPVSEFLVVEPESTAELVVGLEPALGWVFVGANDDAEVRVDDVFVGRGSQSLRLMAGTYTVEIRENGESVLRRDVEVLDGSEESLATPGATPPRRP